MADADAVDSDHSEFEDLDPVDEDGDGKESIKGVVVPYRTVHSPPLSFKTPNRKCFIPGRPINVKIVDVERTASTHRLSPNLYVIQIEHGDYTWTIRRRYKHFQHLNQQLQLYRATLSIPFPTKIHRERRSSYKSSKSESGKTHSLPRFPKRPEALVQSDQQDERKDRLEFFLQNLLKIRAFRNHHETLEFLEVSHLSFVSGLGPKGKEGLVLKRTGTTHTQRCTFGLCNCVNHSCFRLQRCCGEWCGQWQQRWLIAKDTFVAYVRPKDGRIHCVMLIDNEFEVSSGLYDTGVPHGVIISNLTRQLVVKCWTKRKGKEWLDFLRKITLTEAARGFLDTNRFNSYAPIRSNVDAKWFIDGKSYMAAVADTIEAANEEILISDWWLSPEIYMKRPAVEGDRWRLDKLLQRKAKDGVKIFVLLYKEVNLALGINSFYSKQKIVEQDNENIKVLRHPDHVSAGVLLWAHHEKLVVVDQIYAFVGGIDLCYGRWDDHEHRLADLGSLTSHQKATGALQNKITSSKPGGGNNPNSILHLAKATNMVTIQTIVEPGIRKSSHSVVNDQPNVPPASIDEVDDARVITDSQVEMKVTFSKVEKTEAVPNGLEPEEVELENGFSSLQVVDDQIEEGDNESVTPMKGETPPTGRRGLLRKMTKVSKNLKEDGKEWIDKHIRRKGSQDEDSSSDDDGEKKDEATDDDRDRSLESKSRKKRDTNSSIRVKSETDGFAGLQGSAKLWIGKDYTNFIVKDFVDLESPFTDMVDRSTTPRMPWHDIAMMVQGNAARDVARHFIQRWNAVKDEKARMNTAYPYLIPKSYDFKNDHVHPVINDQTNICKVSAQILRSVAQWSSGVHTIEDSIQQAYVDSIEKSKHYVYIENQFFITLASANQQVQNRIGEALLQRILKAHREGATFRVFVVIPLLPGFEGEVGTARGVAIHAITHWNYSSICRGPDALLVRLRNAGIEDPSQYVTFHGLRTFSEIHGDLVTELIYVHSKLMIIDDNLVICGSANINDRSMIGKRDSEVAVILQDENFEQSIMNGADYKAGKFAQSLRMKLFREHLGLLSSPEVDVRDPISENFYRNVWVHTGETNTEIFDEVFKCMPTDKCITFAELREYQNIHQPCQIDPPAARNRLKGVKGNLVMLPLLFLSGENLLPGAGTREGLMPTVLWT